MLELISDDIYPYVACANDSLEDREMYDLAFNRSDNYEKHLEQLCFSQEAKELDGSYYGVFIKTHFDLLSSLPKTSFGTISYDEFDLNVAQRLFMECTKKKLNFESIKKMLISAVYDRHIGDCMILGEIDSLFESNFKKFTRLIKMNDLIVDKISGLEFYNSWRNTLKYQMSCSNIFHDKWGAYSHQDATYDALGAYNTCKILFASSKYDDVRHIKEDEHLSYDYFWSILLSKLCND